MAMFKLVEMGPFECRIERGRTQSLEELPEGYEICREGISTNTEIVYIEPAVEKRAQRIQL
jgi:hypothetical protein